ncbi:Ribonuclease 3 [sediment metagenome]|uniref:ribonuclease III n=1 Tax=sediment metagenome TaxID=749907 RepID=D9PH01_9ZZZZ
MSENDLGELSATLHYEFTKPELLKEAFRHSSYVNEVGDSGLRDNERLEFLGDAVLDLAVSHILMDLFREEKEGILSKCRAAIVNERVLSEVAKALRLGDYLLLGKGEELSNGREKPSILANVLEALIGALYLDGGFSKTKEIIHRLFVPVLGSIDMESILDDFKSVLQEFTQEAYRIRPEYVLVGESGPAHDKTFKVALYIQGKLMAEGEGRSKKEAEQKAAREAFFCLTKNL